MSRNIHFINYYSKELVVEDAIHRYTWTNMVHKDYRHDRITDTTNDPVPLNQKVNPQFRKKKVPWAPKEKATNIGNNYNTSSHIVDSAVNDPCHPWSTTGLVATHVKGRLGNQMGEYASVLSLAKMKGSKPVIPKAMKQNLRLFPNLSVQLYWEDLNHECIQSFHSLNPWKLVKETKVMKSVNIVLKSYPFQLGWFPVVEDQLRKEDFVLKQAMIQDVQDFLSSITTNTQTVNVASSKIDTIFIGIHVRRTDYVKYMEMKYKAKLIGSSFYIKAAKLMQDLIAQKNPTHDMSKKHLAFVVVTDDPDWCRKNMMNLSSEISSNYHFSSSSVHFSADHHNYIEQNRIFFDLAVLSQCNHSIYDYGTFGFWGAYLANGITILGDIGRSYVYIDKIKKANLKDWHFLRYDLEDVKGE